MLPATLFLSFLEKRYNMISLWLYSCHILHYLVLNLTLTAQILISYTLISVINVLFLLNLTLHEESIFVGFQPKLFNYIDSHRLRLQSIFDYSLYSNSDFSQLFSFNDQAADHNISHLSWKHHYQYNMTEQLY